MSEQLPVPPELQHLIEKRDADADRREQPRRSDSELHEDAEPKAEGTERRAQSDRRRRKRRRKSDP